MPSQDDIELFFNRLTPSPNPNSLEIFKKAEGDMSLGAPFVLDITNYDNTGNLLTHILTYDVGHYALMNNQPVIWSIRKDTDRTQFEAQLVERVFITVPVYDSVYKFELERKHFEAGKNLIIAHFPEEIGELHKSRFNIALNRLFATYQQYNPEVKGIRCSTGDRPLNYVYYTVGTVE